MEKYTSFYDWELALTRKKNHKRKIGSPDKTKDKGIFDDISQEDFRDTVKKWRKKNNLELE
jgi:hypothetical protein